MDLQLDDSVVLVVGGASGIGKACVDSFLGENARVVILDISPDVLRVADERENCRAVQVDICDAVAVADAVAISEEFFGPIDHLVHAAAIGSGKFGFPFTNLQPSDWTRVLAVNIGGMVNVAHAVSPGMVKRQSGTMVFVASVAGQMGSPTDPPYSASKAANINFAQVLAKDLAPHGIRVNTVSPGMVKTPLNRDVWQAWHDQQTESDQLSYDDWAQQKIGQVIPLGQWQTVDDVADMIVFLASRRAAQVTGQTINVDGGCVMHS